jgi:murein DD-endopeptidase MepM/ murein hydrolase activator NlpD
MSKESDAIIVVVSEETEPTTSEDIIEEQIVTDMPTLSFSEDETLVWPVLGEVLINFSMEKSVYFATLDQYKYNPAVIIAGDVGEEVWAATDGKVTSIREDAQTGTTVTVDLGDGFEAIYGQLGELHVKEGDRIEEGVLIGYLGEPTKYYSVEGCNLYFQLLKDGEAVDPLHYLDV